jgi:hypothetical protein
LVVLVVKQAEHSLPGNVETVDQSTTSSTDAANTSGKGRDDTPGNESVEHSSSGAVSVRSSELLKVQAFELVSGQNADSCEVAQDGNVTCAETSRQVCYVCSRNPAALPPE